MQMCLFLYSLGNRLVCLVFSSSPVQSDFRFDMCASGFRGHSARRFWSWWPLWVKAKRTSTILWVVSKEHQEEISLFWWFMNTKMACCDATCRAHPIGARRNESPKRTSTILKACAFLNRVESTCYRLGAQTIFEQSYLGPRLKVPNPPPQRETRETREHRGNSRHYI